MNGSGGGIGLPGPTPPTFPTGGGGSGGGGGFGLNLPTLGTLGSLGISTAGLIAGLKQAGFNKKQIKRLMKNAEGLQALILPFAQQLIGFGIDPVKFLQSPQGQSMLRPLQEATARNFEGARMNLVDSSAGSGFSPGSGMTQGPLANLFAQEAQAQSGNVAGLISQSQNAGIQGANLLNQQQGAILPFAQTFSGLPNTGFQLAGAGGQMLNTLLQLQSLQNLFGNQNSNSGG